MYVCGLFGYQPNNPILPYFTLFRKVLQPFGQYYHIITFYSLSDSYYAEIGTISNLYVKEPCERF